MRATHLGCLSWGTAVVRTLEHHRPQICVTPARSGHFSRPFCVALLACFALALPLVLAGYVGAKYLDVGSQETSPGVYEDPQDGVCVVGLRFDGSVASILQLQTSGMVWVDRKA